MKKTKVCAYCRVSTDSADQLNSLSNQQSYFTREITEKGHEFAGIYYDEGLTGTKLYNRKGFNEMLYDAGLDLVTKYPNLKDKRKSKEISDFIASDRKPIYDEIWIKNTSRFARNTLSSKIIDELRKKNVHIFFVEQNINTKDIAQDFLLKLFQLFDEQDSKDKSTKVKTGIEESRRNGIIHTSSKLYGYKYIKEENLLKIIPEEAEVIKMIFNLYAEGYGFRRIINILNEKGYFTRQGKSFVSSAIRRIIDNEKYAGLNNRGKHETGKVFFKYTYPRVKDEYEVHETDKIPAIIDTELFYKCNELLRSKVNYQNQKGIYKGVSVYSGLIKCKKCGNLYHSNVDNDKRSKVKKDVHFYNCSLRKKKGKDACDNPNITVEQIEHELEELCNGKYKRVNVNMMRKTLEVLFENRINVLCEQLNSDNTVIVDKKKQELIKKNSGLKRITDLYQNLEIDEDEYRNRSSNLKKEISALESEIQQLGMTSEELTENISQMKSLNKIIQNFKGKEVYTKEELLEELDHIKIINNNNEAKPFFVFKSTLLLQECSKGNFEPFINDIIKKINERMK